MDIERQHLKSVVFLCIEKKDHAGKIVREPVSTGFLVRVPDPLHGGEWDYLITARHCIEEPTQQLFIRANTSTGFTDWPTSKDDWFTHDDADVAASVFQPNEPVAIDTVPLSVAVKNYLVPAPPELPADSQLRPFFDMGRSRSVSGTKYSSLDCLLNRRVSAEIYRLCASDISRECQRWS